MRPPLVLITADSTFAKDIICDKCPMPVYFTLQLRPDGPMYNYHPAWEQEVEKDGETHTSQLLYLCEHAV